MEKFLFLFSLTVLFIFHGYAQNAGGGGIEKEDVSVKFKNNYPRELQSGDKVNFTCVINKRYKYFMDHHVDFVHVKVWNGVKTETKLFEMLGRKPGTPTQYYNATEGEAGPQDLALVLTMKARYQDDGRLECRAYKGLVVLASDGVDITVYRELDGIQLQFDDLRNATNLGVNNWRSQNAGGKLAVKPGTYPVRCVAEGSNPETQDIEISVRHERVSTVSDVTTEAMAGSQKRYRSFVEANVTICTSDSTSFVECVARPPGRRSTAMSVKMPFRVTEPEIQAELVPGCADQPNITCDTPGAYVGLRYLEIHCSVDHAGIALHDLYFKINDTEVIRVGDKFRDRAYQKDRSRDILDVMLELLTVEDWHFSTEIILHVEPSRGRAAEAQVHLHNDGYRVIGEGAVPTCSVATIAMALSLALYICFGEL